MNRRSAVSLGPGASSLILIFVVLSLTILGMLSLLTARNDLKFSERSAEVIQTVYQLNEMAEKRRAEIENILAAAAENSGDEDSFLSAAAGLIPEGVVMDELELSWSEEIMISLDTDAAAGNARTMSLDCALRILPDAENERTEWIRHDLMVYTEDEWN